MTATTRPQLGELTPGQPVMVCRSMNDMGRGRKHEERYIPAVVVKAARVWVDLKAAESVPENMRWMTWRMRRDTQDEGNRNYSQVNASFATLDQHAWDETESWALDVLKDNGLTVEFNSPWRGRQIELADILVKADLIKQEGS